MAFITSAHHSFDIKLAAAYGVEESILIHHFLHWIRINRLAGRNIRDGKCWTYQSRKDIQAQLPYWNYDKVKYLCEKLVRMGVLVTAGHNKLSFDKTLWYAFADEKAFGVDQESSKSFYEGQKCPTKGKSAQPIPDTKTTDTKKTTTRGPQKPKPKPPEKKTAVAAEKKKKVNERVPASGDQIEDDLANSKLSSDQVQEAIEFYRNNKERVLSEKIANPVGYIIHMVESGRHKDPENKKQTEEENKRYGEEIERKLRKTKKVPEIEAGRESLEFKMGPKAEYVKYTDRSFRDKVESLLIKMNLWDQVNEKD